MQELHNTLAELQREEKEMAAQRLSGRIGHKHKAASKRHQENHINDDDAQAGSSHQNQQVHMLFSCQSYIKKIKIIKIYYNDD